MIAVMWQFTVKPGKESEFEHLYGVNGDWSTINRQSRSYLGTSFLRDQNTPSRYVVIEYWSEMVVYESHRRYRESSMAALAAHQLALVNSAEPMGVFTALDVPNRAGPTWSQRTSS